MKKIEKLETVIFDMDGTALNDAKEMDTLLIKYHQAIKDAGVTMMIASGRLDFMVLNYMNELALESPIIGSNGATITYIDKTKEPIFIEKLPLDALYQLVNLARELDALYHIFTVDGLIGERHAGRLAYYSDTNESKTIEEQVPILIGKEYIKDEFIKDTVKFLVVSEDPTVVAAFEKLARELDLVGVPSGDDLFDITNGGVSKGAAIRTLVDKGIIDLETTLVFGDNYNDVEMLKAAKYPIVMENANDDIKAYAYDICPPNNESGVGQYVLSMLDIHFEK